MLVVRVDLHAVHKHFLDQLNLDFGWPTGPVLDHPIITGAGVL